MGNMRKSLHFIVVVSMMVLTGIHVSAQNFPSKWLFGGAYMSGQENDTWTEKAAIKATVTGEGVLKAVDAEGRALQDCELVKGRPAFRAEAGDCFLFEVPSEGIKPGNFIDFDATMAVDPGAPMDWIVEWLDGGRWIGGRTFRSHGPALGSNHRYTSIYQTFRLDAPSADGMVKVRLRALEGACVPATEGKEPTGYAMLVTSTYIGAYIQDFGTVQPKDTTKVLCLGNSFTYYHYCPVMLKEIAWNEGHYLDISASLKGGRTMKHHHTLEMTQDHIAEGGYDVVFLQDQSQAAAKVGQDRKEHAVLVEDMAYMAEKVRTTSPDCKIIVERTWSYPGKEHGGFGSLKAFDAYSEKGARIMAKAVGNATISPIAEAFIYCREEHPDIMLYHTDGHHQSVYGSYLKSCVNYLRLFGEPFGENPADCGIEPKKAAVLRSIAEKIVL